MTKKQIIRFDWAIKKLLRNKANFDILEGFLAELLRENIKIQHILESESNKETDDDKSNRVDILVENSKRELIIIEIQNSQEYDYFQRMLFGTSKAIAEHIKEGYAYSEVKKVISITIAYFDLGQGKDYVYHGTTVFKGLHKKDDILTLSERQVLEFKKQEVYQIYPEYWVIKVGKFSDKVKDKLDEWIYFFKNSEIKTDFTAKGLREANEKLDVMKMTYEDRAEYNYYLKRLRDKASANFTLEVDARHLIEKARREATEQGRIEFEKAKAEAVEKAKAEVAEKAKAEAVEKETAIVLNMHKANISVDIISKVTNLSEEKIKKIIER